MEGFTVKIFISYGHDDYENLVNAVYEELCKNGYEVWKDNRYEGESGIPAGDDFTDIIYSQIDKSDYVIVYVKRNFGGAVQFYEMAKRKGKKVINIAEKF